MDFLKHFVKDENGQMTIIITIIFGVIGAVIIAGVVSDASFTGLSSTISSYIVPFLLLGLLAVAAFVGGRYLTK